MNRNEKRWAGTLTPAALVLVGGCSPAVVETALTSLRDGTANVAGSVVNAFFENHLGVPTDGEAEEEGGNDLFIHP